MKITLVPILNDNYSYLLEAGGEVAIVDPGEPAPIEYILEERNLRPSFILNTHHHADHIASNKYFQKKYGAKVVAPKREQKRIPDIDIGISDGDTLTLGDEQISVLETPGHTTGHVCFYASKNGALFCGDTLFSMGCGRLFEGTPEEMWASLQKIAALPDHTQIYCAHEYTEKNGNFCLAIEPNNPDLIKRMNAVRKLRANGKPTIPATLETEKKTNVFLRSGKAAAFAQLRRLRDSF